MKISQFIYDLKKYKEYIFYSTQSELKRQVAGTLFGYLWWLLDPILHMIVYTVLIVGIYGSTQEAFPLFVFCALLPWKWITSSWGESTTCIRRKAGVIRQIYLPKFILPLICVMTNAIKFLAGIFVLALMMFVYQVKPTWHLIEVIPLLVVNFIFVYAVSIIFAHIGVLYTDFKNLVAHVLRLWFYLSPGLYSLERIPEQYRWFWRFNPITCFFEGYRDVILYGNSLDYATLGFWFFVSLIILIMGLNKLYSFDKNYAKVV